MHWLLSRMMPPARPSITRALTALVMGALFLGLCGCGANRPDSKAPPEPTHLVNPDQRGGADTPDGMQIEGIWGTLDADQVETAIFEQMAGFNNCFRKAPGSYVSGDVLLAFIVARDGRVENVSVARSDLGAWVVEQCLVEAARFLSFPPPRGNARARFAFPFSWNEAGRRLTRPMAPAWGYATLEQNRRALDRCRRQHKFTTDFSVTVYVSRLGQVVSAGFDAEQPSDEAFSGCVVTALEEMRFPDPGSTVVKYRVLVEAPRG